MLVASSPYSQQKNQSKRHLKMEKDVIARFEQSGQSQHSGMAGFLPAIINHCEKNKIPYTLHAMPGTGYFIRKGYM